MDQTVRDVLTGNPQLVSVLQDMAAVVPNFFGPDVRLGLRLVIDPEDGGDGELFALIKTSLPPDDALHRLRAFDEDWWFEHLRPVAGQLTVTLEYA